MCIFFRDYINKNFIEIIKNELLFDNNEDFFRKNKIKGLISFKKNVKSNGFEFGPIVYEYEIKFLYKNKIVTYITDMFKFEEGIELPIRLTINEKENLKIPLIKEEKNMANSFTFGKLAEKLISNIFGELKFKIDNKEYEVIEINFLSKTFCFKDENNKHFKFSFEREIKKSVFVKDYPSTKSHKLIEIFDYEFNEYVDNIGIYNKSSNLIDIDSQRVKISSRFEFKEPNDIKLYIFLNINGQKIRYVWNYFKNRIIFDDHLKKLITKKCII
jgi:hypothetical protein